MIERRGGRRGRGRGRRTLAIYNSAFSVSDVTQLIHCAKVIVPPPFMIRNRALVYVSIGCNFYLL